MTGDISVGAETFFDLLNTNGAIANDAISTVTAANFSTGSTFGFEILNDSGSIGGNATLTAALSGDLTSVGDAFVEIINSGGTIGGDALIDLSAANLTANSSLFVQIDNTEGTIEGSATINSNLTGTATVSGDANLNIFGSDAATGGAAININGGTYNVTGTFLTTIDGDGAITFNNASVNADVLKVGALGTNGVLNIGGGGLATLSADTTLKLYASGSNGQLNFVSDVTLGGNSAKILAANSVTIVNGVLVTIGGRLPTDVYTGFTGDTPNANYTGFGGNNSTTGTFGGAGATDPQPIENAPPFDDSPGKHGVGGTTSTNGGSLTPPTTNVASSGTIGGRGRGKPTGLVMNVGDSGQLLSLLDGAAPDSSGRITIPASKSRPNWRNPGRTNASDRSKTDRGGMNIRTASLLQPRRLP